LRHLKVAQGGMRLVSVVKRSAKLINYRGSGCEPGPARNAVA